MAAEDLGSVGGPVLGRGNEGEGSQVSSQPFFFFSDMCMQKTGLLVLAAHQRLFTAFQEYVVEEGGQRLEDWTQSFRHIDTHTSLM